jgi:hypothetical protein
MRSWLLILLACCSFSPAVSQPKVFKLVDSLLQADLRFVPAPILFRSPETSWGIGASMGYYFRIDSSARTSNAQLQVVRTFNQQTLFRVSADIFTKDERLFIHYYTGYRKYLDRFYGIGPNSQESAREDFSFNSWITAISVLGKVGDQTFLGLNLRHQNMYNIQSRDSLGALYNQLAQGSTGSNTLGFGPEMRFDSRDNVLSPLKGGLINLLFRHNPALNAANPAFQTYLIDLRHYIPLAKNTVWANRIFNQHQSGNPPFRELSLAGGSELVRGYFQGRYRDKSLAAFETELRFPMGKMLGATLFSSTFQVGPDAVSLLQNRWKGAYGAGLRIFVNQKERIVLRVDVARTFEGHTAFYIDLNESF